MHTNTSNETNRQTNETQSGTPLKAGRFKTTDLAYIAMFAVIIAVCSWISIPTTVPFTLQTFGIFAALGFLGGRRGTFSVIVYILLGLVGLPVFAGFSGGAGVLFGATGGYIIGFLFTALAYLAITRLFGTKLPVMIIAMCVGLLACYAVGTAWFMILYTQSKGAISLMSALLWCVIPFIVPDLLKMGAAILLVRKLSKYLKV